MLAPGRRKQNMDNLRSCFGLRLSAYMRTFWRNCTRKLHQSTFSLVFSPFSAHFYPHYIIVYCREVLYIVPTLLLAPIVSSSCTPKNQSVATRETDIWPRGTQSNPQRKVTSQIFCSQSYFMLQQQHTKFEYLAT